MEAAGAVDDSAAVGVVESLRNFGRGLGVH